MKSYKLRLVTNIPIKEYNRFLNYDVACEEYLIADEDEGNWYKTIFTESEIEDMDITGFEKVEVITWTYTNNSI